jgi:hypothetical protein
MENNQSPSLKSIIPSSLLLTILGYGGLLILFFYTAPTVGPRWVFFFLAFMALTGTALPFAAFLNQRFPSTPPATPGIVLRQSIWVGVYGAALAWLQIGRVLTVPLAILLLVGLGLVEFLLRMSERSQWKPS